MHDVIERLLRDAPHPGPVTSLDAWWDRHRALSALVPIDRALVAGFVMDRLGYAFASGYQAAGAALFGDQGEPGALCATEAGGVHPRAIETRLELEGGHAFDRLLVRRVHVHAASAETLERARKFALADHPGLATVMAYHANTAQLWLESPEMRTAKALNPAHRARLSEALRRLHDVGGCHGSVDQAHVGWRGSDPVLVFPAATKGATLTEDLTRLELVR